MKALQEWWQSLVNKERLVVAILGLLLVVVVFQTLIWQPLYKAKENSYNSSNKQAELLDWLRQQSILLEKLQEKTSSSNSTSGSISQRVDLAAMQQKIEINRFQSSDQNNVQVWLVEADFSKLLLWLESLNKQGIVVDSITITKTNKLGLVDVRASLSNN